MKQITVASAQFDPHIKEKEYNLDKMEELIRRAAEEHKADLVVFPEAAVTGYCYESVEEAWDNAVEAEGAELNRLKRLAGTMQISLLFGAVEREKRAIYNTVFFIKPNGTIVSYRKTHLPFMGVDRFVIPGNAEPPILETQFGKIGIMVCYELRFPEICRGLALKGASLILQPTNLPEGGESHPDFLTRARACENHSYLVSCNRCGTERDTNFIGRSQIVDFNGSVLAEMGTQEGIIAVTLDLEQAEDKDLVPTPGEREMYLFKDRRPELYSAVAAKSDENGFVTVD
ncbi:MAG: carbon-nitrogen hydrolase family protein [Evtepia sp.]